MDEAHEQRGEVRLVAGLGNPGRRYAGTRHNVGFAVADAVCAELGGQWSGKSSWQAEVCGLPGVILVKPRTYMNRSGAAVAAVARFHRIAPPQVLVVYDDVALPLGRLRLRRSGSAGGHNGMQSVIDHLGSGDVPRLRVGIGSSLPGAMVDHVLGGFAPAERASAESAVARAGEAILHLFKKGVDETMNIYNKDQSK